MANISQLRLSGTTYTLVDSTAVHSLDGYATTEQVTNAITAATNALAETIEGKGYQNATEVNAAIDAKVNPLKTELGNLNTKIGDVSGTVEDALGEIATLEADKVGYVNYSKADNKITFKSSESGIVIGEVDTTDFIKDGMIEKVEIDEKTNELVITWNEDGGKEEETRIPLSKIFNPDNYYTTAQTDAKLESYTYDKQTIDSKISASGTFDPTNYYDKHDIDEKVEQLQGGLDAVDGKITSAINAQTFKTVGGQSIKGSGNIQLMTARVDDTTLVLEFA